MVDYEIRKAFEKLFILQDYCIWDGEKYIDKTPFKLSGAAIRRHHVVGINNCWAGYKSRDKDKEVAELKEKLKIAEECLFEIHKRSVYQLGNEQKSDEWFILSCESLSKEALSKLKEQTK